MSLTDRNEYSNLTPRIEARIGRKLHLQKNHPIEILKGHIYRFFEQIPERDFHTYDDLPEVVDLANNFDLLRIPKEHPSRGKTDTYYVNEELVLRTHTSAHQNQLLEKGESAFLVTGDVYRKDEIDRNHYPVFHQMEGVYLLDEGASSEQAEEDLKKTLVDLVLYLFPGCEYRINGDYFPFTEPSFEIEVQYRGEWLEVLGCGVIHREILDRHGIDRVGWAFGLGLERLAMILFSIPDIRYFWSDHPRFLDQFAKGEMVTFKPYSELPSQENDMSFWIPEEQWECQTDEESGEKKYLWSQENIFFGLVGEVGGDMVEQVSCFDEFYHPKKERYARAYRVTFSPIDPSIKDPAQFTQEVLKRFEQIRELVVDRLKLEIR